MVLHWRQRGRCIRWHCLDLTARSYAALAADLLLVKRVGSMVRMRLGLADPWSVIV